MIGVTPAEKALAAAASRPVLTIDRHALRDLWLPTEREESASVAHMDAACRRSCHRSGTNTATFQALNVARCAIKREWEKTTENIRDLGGLLHIGAPGALA